MGTMGYMSPEQVRGLPVDHRSDIFSFGAILYEMLSGKRAFKRDTASDTIAAILKEEPPELTQSGRNVSPALDHIVRHCLEKDRERRFQSAHDIAFALSEASSPTTASGVQLVAPPTGKKKVLIAVLAAVVVLAAGGVLLVRRPPAPAGEAGGVKRVAVLPFENLGAPEDDYFADGIADAIRGKLTSVPGLEVIARGSSTPYKKTTKTPQEIARELDAHYLLTATVRWQKGGREQPRAGQPRARRDPGVRSAGLEVAAALRRGDHGRLPGAVGHRDEGGAGPGRRARGGRAEAALREAHAEPRRLRRLPQGRGSGERPGSQRSRPACARRSASTSRPWRWIPDSRRRGRESRTPIRSCTSTALRLPSWPSAPGRQGRRPSRLRLTARRGTWHSATTNGWLPSTTTAPWSNARRRFALRPEMLPLSRATALAEQGLGRWDAAVEHFRQAERLDPRSVDNHATPRRGAPPAAALSRGAGGHRPWPRPRASQPRS